ncbi:d-beta-hydroxybutyrate dehydrogenase, mitochondrial [Trichonephila clavipes]|nr:d-beta-hydroxybutyrate dehydrogenase, mitochondrial [Trichonephila clavipes]
MEIPLRTAYGQAGRCGMQPKPSSLRAQAHQSKSRTETEKGERAERKENARELWAVINNAGISKGSEVEITSMEKIEEVIDVNLLGTIRVTKAFLPLLRKSKGRIINVASAAEEM